MLINKQNISDFLMNQNYYSSYNDLDFTYAIINCNFEYVVDDRYIQVSILYNIPIFVSKNRYFDYFNTIRKEKLKKIIC